MKMRVEMWTDILRDDTILDIEYLHSPMEGGPEVNEGTDKPTSLGSRLQWTQWQLLDSILPTGGFALSFGLKAAVQACLVSGVEDVQTYLTHVLENTGSLLLPFSHSATISPMGRKASIAQGSALVRVAAAAFSEVPALKIMREASLGGVAFHHAPIFGLICGLLGFDSTAVLQHQMAAVAEDVSNRWMNRKVEEACQSAPLLDTMQGCYGYLFSRLFCS
ncbi:urease accessory protein F [Actinidia rufa]|uniref:Urease accessory protein F n=1 Tax=Actinidia rufa TaxID=165716 RepID=A0A7J0DLK6_9ERIC|nr:urease accessory protein F [Actinidia rufa]